MRISDWSSDVCSSDLSAGRYFMGFVDVLLEILRPTGGRFADETAPKPLPMPVDLRPVLERIEKLMPGLRGRPRLSMIATYRSEARRVGKECVSTCRSRWSPYH